MSQAGRMAGRFPCSSCCTAAPRDPDDFAAGTAMNRLAEEQRLHRRLSKTAAERQSLGMLELVQPEGPEARRGRAEHHRRHHPRHPVGVRRRRVARLCGGPLGRRGDGGDHGRSLSRALRRRRHSLRSRLRFRRRPAFGARRHARRRERARRRRCLREPSLARVGETAAFERSSFMGRTTRRSIRPTRRRSSPRRAPGSPRRCMKPGKGALQAVAPIHAP